jgi:hypothetical protein
MKKEIEITANNLYGMNIKVDVLGEPRVFTVMDFKEIISGYNDKSYLLVIRGTFTEFEQSKLYCDWRAYHIVLLEDVTEIIEHDDTFANVYADFFKNDISNGMSFEDYMGIETARAYFEAMSVGFGRNIETIAEDGEDECLPTLNMLDTHISGWKRAQDKNPEYTNETNDDYPDEIEMVFIKDELPMEQPLPISDYVPNDLLEMDIAQDMLGMDNAVKASEYIKRMTGYKIPEYTREQVDEFGMVPSDLLVLNELGNLSDIDNYPKADTEHPDNDFPDEAPDGYDDDGDDEDESWEEDMEDDESTSVDVDLSEWDSPTLGKCLAFACGYPIYECDLHTFQNRS